MTEPTSPDVTELIERLHQIAENDWRISFLAHTSDTAKEAADALLTSRQEIERLTAERESGEALWDTLAKGANPSFQIPDAIFRGWVSIAGKRIAEQRSRAEAAEAALALQPKGN